MLTRGLKSSLITNLLLALAGAMLLIDLVLLSAARQEQLRERVTTGQTLLAAVASMSEPVPALPVTSRVADSANEADASCLRIFGPGGNLVADLVPGCGAAPELSHLALQTLVARQPMVAISGSSVGFFWPGSSVLAVCRPLKAEQGGGVIGAELSLAGLYQSLRHSQRAFSVYFLINLLLFVVLGFIRLYRSMIKPIDRLVDTVADFRDDDEFTFRSDEQESEFNRLSRSLNQMLGRIKRDRAKLEESVASLESANQGLRRAQQEMVRAEKLASVGRLAAGVAHEIGNPMGIIAAYLELLKQPGLAEMQKVDYIRRAEGEAGRVNTIIRQLLDFARPPREEAAAEVSVHALVIEVRELCTIQPLLAGVAVRLDLQAKNDLVVGTGEQLRQILFNLVLNGADAIASQGATPPVGIITIRTANNQGTDPVGREVAGLQLEVMDNGPGFVESELANVFDPFYTTKEPGKGTGLGLSICFTIVGDLGGTINAASNPEGGARISIFLPQSAAVIPNTTFIGLEHG